jgi:plasmid stability protein
MAALTIRNLDEGLKERLRIRAATNGRSMEDEVRVILRDVVGGVDGPSLFDLSRQLFSDKGVNLDLPPRDAGRAQPDFGGFHEE